MNKKRTILGGAILVAVLMLGIGYAAIDAITLNISGSAKADASDANFIVQFDSDTTVATSGDGTITASITDAKNAVLNVSGLSAKGQSATATYTIENESPDLSANLTVDAESITETDNAGYFSIKTTIAEATLASKGKTTATVTVTLNKTPVDAQKTGTINVQLKAEPVQP